MAEVPYSPIKHAAESIADIIERHYEKQPIQDELEVNFFDSNGSVRIPRALVSTTPLRAAEIAQHLVKTGLRATDIIEVRELRRDGIVSWRYQSGLLEKSINEHLERERGEGTRK
jgi:hypothetical protein